MTIGELLDTLSFLPDNMYIQNINLKEFGSDRGDYIDFYVGHYRTGNSHNTVKEFKEFLRDRVIGKEFRGYKGGEFLMDEDSEIRLGCYGESGDHLDGVLVNENGANLKVQRTLHY
ncbi:MAG: hypothetical protein A2Y34_03965 [Spirochaetes bacterium GWC1_27_15]|nr:MAG: hypothetical protein A2Y34_03965 [Spirochaetes bacterium GWC1_27_15]